MKTKTASVKSYLHYLLRYLNFPNFHKTGSIKGMKKIYGKDCLPIKCGNYIYNVDSKPDLYYSL